MKNKINIDLEASILNSSGGFGDALICMNKYKSLGLHEKPGVTLQHFTEQESAVPLIEKMFELNGIQKYTLEDKTQTYLVHFKPGYTQLLKAIKNQKRTFTTAWDGNIDNDPGALDSFVSDMVPVQAHLLITGEAPDTSFDTGHYILQLDAGLQYHNPRKHWDNIYLVLSTAKIICKKFNLKAIVIGAPENIELTEEFFDIRNKGFQSIEYIKTAKFVLGLSSFVTLCSLMCGIPTIYKKETDFIHERFYGHPDWKPLLTPVNEINTDLKNILNTIEEILK